MGLRQRGSLAALLVTVLTAVPAALTGCASSKFGSTPPPFVVAGRGAPITAAPGSYCWDTMCADSAGPPASLPDIGRSPTASVTFSLVDWPIELSLRRSDQTCGRIHRVTVLPTGTAERSVSAVGRPGTYDVDVFAARDGHSTSGWFRWTTTVAGPPPRPAAEVWVLAEHDARIDSFGVGLHVVNLARTPRLASATVTVRSAEGRSETITLLRDRTDCTEGTVQFSGPEEAGRDAARLGSAPFRYDVRVVLDGVVHRASAAFPADQVPDREPSVGLEFRPALPAVRS